MRDEIEDGMGFRGLVGSDEEDRLVEDNRQLRARIRELEEEVVRTRAALDRVVKRITGETR